ncbi:MAG: hypothetical protein LW832_04240 [Parachlamydia sp.]|jgi:hypothetical protein|nr:hypothetical protein [Parachlamydia sp.]
MRSKTYYVKILDFNYRSNFQLLAFRYLTYEVVSSSKKMAIKAARELYMSGAKEKSSESLPLLLNIFSVNDC